MASNSGRHSADENPADENPADENAADRARVDYLAGEPVAGGQLDPSDQAELDELRALLADPTLWAEPPAELEDSVVALIGAEARGASAFPPDGESGQPPFARPSADAGPAVAPAGPARSAPGSEVSDLTAARERKQRRTGARRFTRPAFLVAAAAAIVAVTVSGVLLLRPASTREFAASLSATDLAPGASGTATMLKTDSGWEIHLDATGLPRLDGGQFYQGWLRNADGVLVPIGTFNEGTDVTLWAGVPPDQFPTITITRESADGDQASSGQRVLVGTAVEK